ncbi:MAG: hypothetical protein LBS19_10740 [Clostridiales bacterium]|jgi:vacuolar-type H+-ATPase subunit E/Vma4|nr:hypothetical protein [Clostridiales bacterium]
MNIKNKLAVFSKAAVKQAEQAAAVFILSQDELIADEERLIADNYAAETQTALAEAAEGLREQHNRAVFAAERDSRRKLLNLCMMFTDELFADVKARLIADILGEGAKGRPGYLKGLIAGIGRALADYPAASGITLTERDRAAAMKSLPPGLDITVDDDILGGFIMTISAENIAVDCSVAGLLAAEREEIHLWEE